jgi:hypothetical protein
MTTPATGAFVGLPTALNPSITSTKNFVQALDNFHRVFAIRPGDEVLVLADPLLDPRVIDAVIGVAKARGAQVRVYMEPSTQVTAIPPAIEGLLRKATFVVSTWFCSILDPLAIQLRREGQRWVKITYFRDFDLLHTPQARFPIEVVGEIIRATAQRFPRGQAFDLRFTDTRGSDFRIHFTADMCTNQLATNRWRGRMVADEDGCYVHYLPTHGPNFWDSTAMKNDGNAAIAIDGVLYPQGAIGFDQVFEEPIAVEFRNRFVTAVHGHSTEAGLLREMLVGGKLIEGGGCGFNPRAPRDVIYPAGSNAPGALHFGIDLAQPSDWIRRHMPNWEEPPVHQDLIVLDATVTAGDQMVIDQGFLCALRDPEVVQAAARYGDPVSMLESP